jgi:hypothetical protein
MAPEEANSLGGARIGLRGRGSGDRLRVSIGPEHVHYLSIRDPAPQHPPSRSQRCFCPASPRTASSIVPDWLFDLSAMTLRGYAPSDEDVLQVCNPIFGTLLFFFRLLLFQLGRGGDHQRNR